MVDEIFIFLTAIDKKQVAKPRTSDKYLSYDIINIIIIGARKAKKVFFLTTGRPNIILVVTT